MEAIKGMVGHPDGTTIVANHPSHGEVGYMELEPHRSGEWHVVSDVQVPAQFRRQGIATALWNHAKAIGLNPQHSSWRTKAGDKWAHSTGDEVPPNVYGD